MHPTFLQAKLFRPAPPATAIARPALLQLLWDGLSGKVTLVSAPAGYGKSTLVTLWLDQIEAQATDTKAHCALGASWLSLEEADNQLPRFVRYLAAAIEERYPHSCTTVVQLLYDKEPPAIETLADLLANAVSLLADRLIVVLDDLHLIDDAAVYAFLTRLIQHSTNQMHLVLITRIDPPLPLNRWRAQGKLHEIRAHDLGFSLPETTTFLSQNLATTPDPAVVSMLHERTEGWVVGLRLALLTLRAHADDAEFATHLESTNSRYIVDYLVDDVLAQQPASVQTFLICTSILRRFSSALCAAVVEIDEATAQQHIDHIARANLFLVGLGEPAHWYRYHHQFQAMLLSRLHERYDEQAIAQLHRQAAAWLAAHGQIDDALRHLMAIGDFAAVADLVESQRVVALNEHRFHELEDWLTLLPTPLLQERPALLLGLAWIQDHRLEFTKCLATTQRAADLLHEQAATLSPVTHKLLQTETVALRASVDRTLTEAEALALIERAWAQLRPYLSYTHCIAVVWLAHTYHRLGGGERALEFLLTTFEQTVEWPQIARCRLLYSAGILYWYNCHLAQAERSFQKGLHLAQQHRLPVLIMLCHFGLAVTASRYDQRDLAETYHLEVVKEPTFQNGLRAVVSAYDLIRLYAGRGQPEEGRRLVERLKTHALIMGRPFLLSQVAALEAYAALYCGDRAAALHWALAGSPGEMYSATDLIPLIRAQLLLAEGSAASLHEASQLLAGLSRRHESERAWIFWIDVAILQAMTWAELGWMDLALALLGRAVQRAIPNNVVGPFVGWGRPLNRLLHELAKQPEQAALMWLLQAAMPTDSAASAQPMPLLALPEPLTEREVEILSLLAGRLSNREIAERLIISPHTVRNHTANIFAKLQVETRLDAVERARALGLLPTPLHSSEFK